MPQACTELTTRCPNALQVADIADVVRQRADALMLSGESAVGAYPEKALAVLRQVSTRIEEWCRRASVYSACQDHPAHAWPRLRLPAEAPG